MEPGENAEDVLRALGTGICPHCGEGGYLLARAAAMAHKAALVTVTASDEISWCDGFADADGESFYELWGHATAEIAPPA